MGVTGGAPGDTRGCRTGCPTGCPWVHLWVLLWMLQVVPTGASLGAPSDAHRCLAGCLEQFPRMPLWVPSWVPLWVLQVMPMGVPLDAPSDSHGCPSGCSRCCPRVPRSMGAALGAPVPRWAPRAMPGDRREVEPGWGGKSHPRAKSGKRRETAPKRRRGGSRPDRASYPNQKSRRSASAPPAAPARLFGGSPLPPGGRGCPLPPQLYFTRSPDSRFRFAAADTHRERTRAASRGRAPPAAPPAPPGPA